MRSFFRDQMSAIKCSHQFRLRKNRKKNGVMETRSLFYKNHTKKDPEQYSVDDDISGRGEQKREQQGTSVVSHFDRVSLKEISTC